MRNILFLLFIVAIFLLSGCSNELHLQNNSINNDILILDNYTLNNSVILKAFENQTWVGVIVRLRDDSNLTITGTAEEKQSSMLAKDAWFGLVVDSLIKDLPNRQIRDIDQRRDGFGADVTKDGFDLLINDIRVEEVIWVNDEYLKSKSNCETADDCWKTQACINNTCVDSECTNGCSTGYVCDGKGKVCPAILDYPCINYNYGDNTCKKLCKDDDECFRGKCNGFINRGSADNIYGDKVCNSEIPKEIATKGETFCNVASDCVPAQCCHPSKLVNKYFEPDCSGTKSICTAQCMRGTLDCGRWIPTCENNTCGVTI